MLRFNITIFLAQGVINTFDAARVLKATYFEVCVCTCYAGFYAMSTSALLLQKYVVPDWAACLNQIPSSYIKAS